jgi:hypothetical protein
MAVLEIQRTTATNGVVVLVKSPDIEATVQEVVDAIRDFEDEPSNLDLDPILVASGKDPLGAISVGVTITLLNGAQVQFEARPGPGWVVCNLSGGNVVARVGDEASATQFPIKNSPFVNGFIAQSASATLLDGDISVELDARGYTQARATLMDFLAQLDVSQMGTIAAMVDLMRKYVTNAQEVDVGTQEFIVYEDDGTTPLQTHDLTTEGGEPMTTNTGVQVKRGAKKL